MYSFILEALCKEKYSTCSHENWHINHIEDQITVLKLKLPVNLKTSFIYFNFHLHLALGEFILDPVGNAVVNHKFYHYKISMGF